MDKDSLRNLVESGAAKHHTSPRSVWIWVLEAISNDQLDAWLPPDPHGRFNSPEIREEFWRRKFAEMTESARRGNDPSLSGWTSELMIDVSQFQVWLKIRCRKATPPERQIGPKVVGHDLMKQAFKALSSEGKIDESTKKSEAHRLVLNVCKSKFEIKFAKDKTPPRGFSYQTFVRACYELQPSKK